MKARLTDPRAQLAARLEDHVRAVSGPRHWQTSRPGLERAELYVETQLQSLGLPVRRQPFSFREEPFENLIATVPGSGSSDRRLLVGAHLDTVRGSPGANDNGSGLAGLIEVA
ncbi:MAG: M28 family peptidase, partial [Longimicrobiales bacterium]